MDEQPPSSDSRVQTYHCICTTLILAIPFDLESLPTRATPAKDQAIILPLRSEATNEQEAAVEPQLDRSVLHNVIADRKPIIVQREDGFERRTMLRCQRCRLLIGYNLDDSMFEQNTLQPTYILPGGLVSTASMKAGSPPEQPTWAAEKT